MPRHTGDELLHALGAGLLHIIGKMLIDVKGKGSGSVAKIGLLSRPQVLPAEKRIKQDAARYAAVLMKGVF